MNKKIQVGICIPAYNEEQNIEKLLLALKQQKLNKVEIIEIILIASGCTDKTVINAKKLQKQIPKLKIITEKDRNGKSFAINKFLSLTKTTICIISSADIIPQKETIEALCSPFTNPTTGMTGAHPIPTNDKNRFLGFAVIKLWEMHHQIALKTPKCGEMIAFRKIFNKIDPTSPVDEASIEHQIKQHNLKIKYIPTAIVYNKGPKTIKDFIKQRKRIHFGHLWLKQKYKYSVSTNKKRTLIPIILQQFTTNIKKDIWLIGLITLEFYARILAKIDFYIKNKSYSVWEQIKSTK